MKKKWLSVVLTIAMVLSFTATAYADDGIYSGAACTEDKNASALIDYIMVKYKESTLFPLPGECWGYAEKVNAMMSKENQTDKFENLELTKENFMDKCLGVKAGTHIRLNKKPSFDSWTGHSIILFKVTEDEIFWADNNYNPYNTVHYRSGTFDDFYNMYGHYGWLTMVSQPMTHKTYKTSSVLSSIDEETGAVRLKWLKSTVTYRYEVHRSTSRNGEYKKVFSTTGKTYLDLDAKPGVKYYYKIVSVKKTMTRTGNIASRTRKLAQPIVTAGNDYAGNIQLTWQKVDQADKYYVYRYDGNTGTFKKVKTITDGTTYTDKVTTDGAVYKVKAIYTANTYGNSCYSEEVSGWRI